MSLEFLSVNYAIGPSRKEVFQDREYLVAPITMIVEGVLNGSAGPLLYTKTEIEKSPQRWNGIPIVINHPKNFEGSHISARQPDVINKGQIGIVFNVSVKTENSLSKLVGEGWFDIEKVKRLNLNLYHALLNNQKVEVSTGLFFTFEPSKGVFNDKEYVGKVTQFMPDHLAILPTDKGACSVKDGCGVFNEISLSEKERQLVGQLRARMKGKDPDIWIEEMFDDYIIYRKKGDLYKLSYSMTSEDEAKLEGGFGSKVVKETRYLVQSKPVKETQMKLTEKQREEAVSFLIGNCDCWDESDREFLGNLDDEKLIAHKQSLETLSSTQEAFNEASKEWKDEEGNTYTFNSETHTWDLTKKEKPKAKPVKPKNEPAFNSETIMENLPEDVKADLEYAKNAREQERLDLIDEIVSRHPEDDQKEVHNSIKDEKTPALKKMIAVLPKKVEEAEEPSFRRPNFRGAGAPVGNRQANNTLDDDDIYVPTYPDFSKKA